MSIPKVTLVNGDPLDEEQSAAFGRLFQMMETTQSTGTLQTEHKEQHNFHQSAKLVKEKDTYSSWTQDGCLLRRYLVANGFNDKKAYDGIMNTVYWREHHIPRNFAVSFYDDCIRSRFVDWRGHDKQGRPSLFIKSCNADLSIPREHRLSFLTIVLEKGLNYMKKEFSGQDGVEQWNMVIDETGKEYKHMDNKFISQVSPIVNAHYVERLNRCYVINPGILTKVVLGAVKLFVDERTSSKLVSCDGKVSKENKEKMTVEKLLEDFGEENTPAEYGGKLQPMDLGEYTSFFSSIPPVK